MKTKSYFTSILGIMSRHYQVQLLIIEDKQKVVALQTMDVRLVGVADY